MALRRPTKADMEFLDEHIQKILLKLEVVGSASDVELVNDVFYDIIERLEQKVITENTKRNS